MSLVLGAGAGALFGAGLVLAGMTQPSRVIAFLDVLGSWDPTLAFVMAGAVAVYSVAYRVIHRRAEPWFDTTFHLPKRADIDRKLVLGAAMFGVGWGLVGLCPGPALVSLSSGRPSVITFVAAMVVGMLAGGRKRRCG
jgi:uncharacterized membrane protein YedE/YeeE